MKKSLILTILFATLLSSVMGIIYPNPWVLSMGRLEISLGWPTLALRYGLLDVLEVGGSVRESGGYIKLGYNTKNFGVAIGYSIFFGGYSSVFASVGVSMGGFQVSISGRFHELAYGTEPLHGVELSAELLKLFSRQGNSTNYFGIAGNYFQDVDGVESSEWNSGAHVYFVSDYQNVWIFSILRLLGGLSFYYDGEPVSITKNFGVIFGISTFFDVFER